MTAQKLTLFHCPHTRSIAVLGLLEELGVEYELELVNLKTGDQRKPEYLAINPMGKVPALRHGDVVIIERPAIMMYLADLFPEKGLAPRIGDPLRGPYLQWMVFYGACFEPALLDHSLKREPAPRERCAYGDYESVMNAIAKQLEKGPYLLGEQFTAADVLWGGSLSYTMAFGLVPELPVFRRYADLVASRPALQRAVAKDAELLKAMGG